ncbi:hypothetical protein [Leptothoe sp. PORK10 BA2]|uniref:hypothetical protein n=1 Tax=Leptothoe sp. PORK10 BA2 TaxID=3110254 RepID=UPI002B1F5B2C|nr:hypothetical protein [Leptothoe sp. PORK10 BA2]MEA5463934.1 hypothetical protein [Leptothoe sp. PORK10 BA2]
MRPVFATKPRPTYRRSLHRRRAARQDNLQALGSTVGMPLFLQRQPSAANVTQQDESEPETLPTSGIQNIVEPLPNLEGEGESYTTVVYGNSLRLQGRTRARFSNSFLTENVVTAPAEGCEGCRASNCVHVTGTLVSTFTVTTTVTLPSVADFPHLTSCQQQRVQDAIDTVLAPHEQQHVSAFQTYNGTVSPPFDLTICRGRFAAQIQAMHNSLQSSRRSAAQGASDALDPFHFDVDLNC